MVAATRRIIPLLWLVLGAAGAQAAELATAPGMAPDAAAGAGDMPMADYLALLGQIAPAAEDGAKTYLAAFAQRCGRPMSTGELRRAISLGNGDPVLMGLIRASQMRSVAARDQLVLQLRCPGQGGR
jgi:hypothetical protein